MAFVTYILLAALTSGLNSRFHPEILASTASKALAVMLIDFCCLKGGCYLLNVQVSALILYGSDCLVGVLQGNSQVLDLLAYNGYKFVGCVAPVSYVLAV